MTAMDSDADVPQKQQAGSAIYFDGKSNQRRAVTLHLAEQLEIRDGDTADQPAESPAAAQDIDRTHAVTT